jgi:hypothetical protein
MVKQSLFRIELFVAIFAFFCITGCSNTNSTSAPPTTLTVPNTGSMFVMNNYEIDSSSRMIGSTQYYDTIIVIATGMTYMGKTNVMQLQTPTSRHNLYRNFESNGDISTYYPGNGKPGDQPGWVTYPVGSKGKTTFNTFDTTVFGTREVQTLTLTYTNSTTRTLAGHNFYIDGIQDNLSGAGTPDGTTYGPDTMWFAPEIGQHVGSDRPPYHLTNGKWNNGYHSELSFYLLK